MKSHIYMHILWMMYCLILPIFFSFMMGCHAVFLDLIFFTPHYVTKRVISVVHNSHFLFSLSYNIILWKYITIYLSRLWSASCQRYPDCFYSWYYLRRRNVIRMRTFCHLTAEKLLYMPPNGAFGQMFLLACMYTYLHACVYHC